MIAIARDALVLAGLGASLAAQCANYGSPGGSGCGGFTPFGIPMLACSGAPTIGSTTFGFTATAPCAIAPATAAILLVGACLSQPLVFTSGFGPGGLCGPSMATCALFVDFVVTLQGVPATGGFSYSAPIPNAPQLVGLQLCAQQASYCPAIPCIGGSHGVRVTLQ